MNVPETDRQIVIDEFAACQERILQTFVPTIISVGLIAIVGLRIFLIPRNAERYHKQWLTLLSQGAA